MPVSPSTKPGLLATARAVLRDELLPQLPTSRKYEALMIANAMAIADRESKQGAMAAFPETFYETLSKTLDRKDRPDELLDALIMGLRQGRFHPENPATSQLHQQLLDEAKRRVTISNPRYLTP